MLLLTIAFASSAFGQGSGQFGCVTDIHQISGQAIALPLYENFQSCCCEQNYLSFKLYGGRINIGSLLREVAPSRKFVPGQKVFVHVVIDGPGGIYESILGARSLKLLEDPQPRSHRDDSVFILKPQALPLSPSTLAAPGEYRIELTVYLFADKDVPDGILPVTTARPVLSPGLSFRSTIQELQGQGLVEKPSIRFDLTRQIYHKIEDGREHSDRLKVGCLVYFRDCQNPPKGDLQLDQQGLLRDEEFFSVREDFIVLGAVRDGSPSLSSLSEIQPVLEQLRENPVGSPNTEALQRAFEILTHTDFITEYDKYFFKLELLNLFGANADISKLALPERSLCEFVPDSMSRANELIYLRMRYILLRKDEIWPGTRIAPGLWCQIIDKTSNEDLWPIARDFYAGDLQKAKKAVMLLGGCTATDNFAEAEESGQR